MKKARKEVKISNKSFLPEKQIMRKCLQNKQIILQFFQCEQLIIIIIMVIFKCYFSGEHIALSIKIKTNKQNNNGVNIELGKTNRLKALCMMQINT